MVGASKSEHPDSFQWSRIVALVADGKCVEGAGLQPWMGKKTKTYVKMRTQSNQQTCKEH